MNWVRNRFVKMYVDLVYDSFRPGGEKKRESEGNKEEVA